MQLDELNTFYLNWMVKGAGMSTPEWLGGKIGAEYESGKGVMKGWTERLFAIWDEEEKGGDGDDGGEDEGK